MSSTCHSFSLSVLTLVFQFYSPRSLSHCWWFVSVSLIGELDPGDPCLDVHTRTANWKLNRWVRDYCLFTRVFIVCWPGFALPGGALSVSIFRSFLLGWSNSLEKTSVTCLDECACVCACPPAFQTRKGEGNPSTQYVSSILLFLGLYPLHVCLQEIIFSSHLLGLAVDPLHGTREGIWRSSSSLDNLTCNRTFRGT